MTLTTERLKWLHDAATELSATKLKMTMRPDELLVLTSELLANREAQPVGYFVRYRSVWDKEIMWRPWTECSAEDYAEYCKLIAAGGVQYGRIFEARILYDAPPAPATAQLVAWEMRYWNNGYYTWGEWERITAEQHAEMSVQHAADNDYEFRVLYDAPPAPAVPPEATPENIENLLADITLFFTAGSLSHGGSVMFAEVWNACRAATLAAEPEGGNDHNTRR